MSKVSNKQRLECLKTWSENQKYRAKQKTKKQPTWLKEVLNNEN
jgi:hypothetical protein